jgi:hypothetical protein
MLRRSLGVKCVLGVAIVALFAVGASAGFVDNFDTGYATQDLVGLPWVYQTGAPVRVVEWAGGAASSPFLLGTNSADSGGPAMISRPTGVAPTDTDVTLSSYFFGELNSSTLSLVLGPHADPGTVEWRGSDNVGSLSLFWNCGYGAELYYVGNDGNYDYYDRGGVAKMTGKVDFRFVAPRASGAQTVAVDWKVAGDSTWTNMANIPVESGFSADYIGLRFAGAGSTWVDDVSFQSTVPEPSSLVLVLGVMVGLVAYAWRKRR